MKSSWLGEYPGISYNNWLREEALDSNNMLNRNMVKLRQALSVLDSVISQAGISTERSERVSTAINHLITEVHLLVISTGET